MSAGIPSITCHQYKSAQSHRPSSRCIPFMPEAQTLFTAVQGADGDSPALIAACFAGAWPTPAFITWPINTSSTSLELTPARETASVGHTFTTKLIISQLITARATRKRTSNGCGSQVRDVDTRELALQQADGRTRHAYDTDISRVFGPHRPLRAGLLGCGGGRVTGAHDVGAGVRQSQLLLQC